MHRLRFLAYQLIILAVVLVGLLQGLLDLLLRNEPIWAIGEFVLFGVGLLAVATLIEIFDASERRERWSEIWALWQFVFAAVVHLPSIPNVLAIMAVDMRWTKNQFVFEAAGRFHRTYILVPVGFLCCFIASAGVNPETDLVLRLMIPLFILIAVVRVSFNIPLWPALGVICGTVAVVLFWYMVVEKEIITKEMNAAVFRGLAGFAERFPVTPVFWFCTIWFAVHLAVTLWCVAFKKVWFDEFGNLHTDRLLRDSKSNTGISCTVEAAEEDFFSAVLPGEHCGSLRFTTSGGPTPEEMWHVPYHRHIKKIVEQRSANFNGNPVQVNVTVNTNSGSGNGGT